jgi:hypothetical protein
MAKKAKKKTSRGRKQDRATKRAGPSRRNVESALSR